MEVEQGLTMEAFGKAPSLSASHPGCWLCTWQAAGQAPGRILFEFSWSSWSVAGTEGVSDESF